MCHHIWHVGLTREKWLKPKIISTLHHRIKGKKKHTRVSIGSMMKKGKRRRKKRRKRKKTKTFDRILL